MVARKRQEKKKEQKPTSVQLNAYVSYYDLFKSISK